MNDPGQGNQPLPDPGVHGASTDGLSAPALRRQVMNHLQHEDFMLVAAYASGTMVGFDYASNVPRAPSIRPPCWTPR